MADGIAAYIGCLRIIERPYSVTDIHQVKRRIDLQKQTFNGACQVVVDAKIGCKSENRHEMSAKVLLHQFAFFEKKLMSEFICKRRKETVHKYRAFTRKR